MLINYKKKFMIIYYPCYLILSIIKELIELSIIYFIIKIYIISTK